MYRRAFLKDRDLKDAAYGRNEECRAGMGNALAPSIGSLRRIGSLPQQDGGLANEGPEVSTVSQGCGKSTSA